MHKNIRVIALILAIVFVAFVALALSFELIEANHDCAGEDCPICEQMAFLSATIHSVAMVLLVILLAVLAVQGAVRLVGALKTKYIATTPVALKVKLSN